MDILIHTFSGVAAGTVAASYSSKGFFGRLGIIGMGGLGGALPDFDVISLWSGFDSTIGKAFNLAHSGKEIYFSKFWYSHHGFLHSLAAGILIAFIFGFLFYLVNSKFKEFSLISFRNELKTRKLLLLAFLSGFTIHLFEDMPTPASAWGGVNFFWPSKAYLGGSGDIWWWNNYDIFLIVIGVILVNTMLLIFNRFLKSKVKFLTPFIMILGIILSVYQIKNRGYDFNYAGRSSSYGEMEMKSKAIQKKILGEKTFSIMEGFDNKLKLNF